MTKKVDSLPAIPVVAQKILSLKINTDEGEEALFKLIEKDPSIMSKIIGLSNSPVFGSGRKILTLHDAETVLGTKRVKMIALGLSMMSSVAIKSKHLLDIEGLWKHSLSIALTMDTLVGYMPKERHPPEDEIYLSGLLHDIGYLVLSYTDPQLCDQFCQRLAAEPNRSVEDVESETLEKSHCELGAELGQHWGLPESIVAVLRGHQNPSDNLGSAQQSIIALSLMAAKLLPTFGCRDAGQMNISDDEWLGLGIDPLFADEIKAKVLMHTEHAEIISF
jgi:HD-like signal output (HDOD) protein